jgi:voltage-gated potassium channel Kch
VTSFLASVRSRWWALGAAWLLVSVLGFWGITVVAGDVEGAPKPIVDRIYMLPEFFARGIDFKLAHADWRIDSARLLGPIVAGLTFFQGLATVFSERLARVTARRKSGHVIVCGLGDKGLRLTTDFLARGDSVVAIERDVTAPGIAVARRAGATVLIGDAADGAELHAAGAARAKEIVAVCGADGTNAEIADRLRTLITTRKVPLLCTVHLSDDRLAGQLRLQSIREEINELRIEFFSIYRGGAAVWIGEHLPITSTREDTGPHVVVIGLGQLGRSLVVRAGQTWAEADAEQHRPLRCTFVDRFAGGRHGVLVLEHPAVVSRIKVETIDLDLTQPSEHALSRFRAVLDEAPDAVFVAFDNDEASLSAALLARHGVPSTTKVVARTRSTSGLGLLMADEGFGGSLEVVPFPLIDRTCSADVLSLGVNELLARSLHDGYLLQLQQGARTAGGSFGIPWDELPEDAKESNRSQAESIFKSLRAVGFDLIPVRRWIDDDCGLSPDAIETIAELEHERWRAERLASGWTYGEVRDDVAKHNPLLVSWDELSDAAKEPARESARDLPHVLARAGFEIIKR